MAAKAATRPPRLPFAETALCDVGRPTLAGARPRCPVQLLAKLLPRAAAPWAATPELPAQGQPGVGPRLRSDQKCDAGAEYHASGNPRSDQGDRAPVGFALEWPAAWNIGAVSAISAAEFGPPEAPRRCAKCFFG